MRAVLLYILLLLGWSHSAAQAEVFERTLANGLKVVVKEDHRAPVVVQQIWYKAGSMDESTGTTGVAHVLEHMMFKGTKAVPAGEFSKRIAAAGGRENAFTSTDYTAYFKQLHKSQLPLAMKLESDRMQNLNLTAKEFSKEIKVVMEERRMRTDDEPQSLMNEIMMSTIYQEHPYHNPVIGWMSDLQVTHPADDRVVIGMLLINRRHHDFIHQRLRFIVGAHAPLFHDYLDLLAEFLRSQIEVLHPVRFQLHRQRQLGFVQLLEISGVVGAGKSILARPRCRDALGKFARWHGLGALEHHMLQRVRDAGGSGALVHAAGLVPDLLHHHRRAVIFLDDDFQPVRQRAFEHFRLRGAVRPTQQQQNIKQDSSHISQPFN